MPAAFAANVFAEIVYGDVAPSGFVSPVVLVSAAVASAIEKSIVPLDFVTAVAAVVLASAFFTTSATELLPPTNSGTTASLFFAVNTPAPYVEPNVSRSST